MGTPTDKTAVLDEVLAGLMHRYRQRVPDVGKILNRMVAAGLIETPEAVENDHIAFRTLGVPQLGIASLEKVFLHLGYQRRDPYAFPVKKLNAYWYSPPGHNYPRVFISELKVEELSAASQRIIHSYADEVPNDPVDALDLDDAAAIDDFLHAPLWRLPTWDDYQALAEESEYAAWVIYNRYYLNHFTICVHNLPPPYNTIPRFNEFLEAHGIELNESGGKVKRSEDGLLIQSSTVAQKVNAPFDDGKGGTEVHAIPGSYVEFAERKVLPEYAHLPADQIEPQHRRDGFEASNADKIFESTYRQSSSGDKSHG